MYIGVLLLLKEEICIEGIRIIKRRIKNKWEKKINDYIINDVDESNFIIQKRDFWNDEVFCKLCLLWLELFS